MQKALISSAPPISFLPKQAILLISSKISSKKEDPSFFKGRPPKRPIEQTDLKDGREFSLMLSRTIPLASPAGCKFRFKENDKGGQKESKQSLINKPQNCPDSLNYLYDRRKITDGNIFPGNLNGLVYAKTSDSYFRGSCILIGEYHAITAAHVVLDDKFNRAANYIEVLFGWSGSSFVTRNRVTEPLFIHIT